MVCFWRCSQNHSFQQWIKQIIQLSINVWLIDIPKSNRHQNRLYSAVLPKTALFSLKSFCFIHVLFFWQNSTTNCVCYPLVWFKWAKSLYLMFTKLAANGVNLFTGSPVYHTHAGIVFILIPCSWFYNYTIFAVTIYSKLPLKSNQYCK